jgi:hypothetical protein
MSDQMLRAVDSYQNDARFRALAQSAVARAMHEHGIIDPDYADREAHDIALKATVNVLQAIYEDDAELRALRERVKALEQLAFTDAMLRPMTPIAISLDM